MRGHYRGDGGISFNVTGIARQSVKEQEPSRSSSQMETFMNV
jgi:hypothetical protein